MARYRRPLQSHDLDDGHAPVPRVGPAQAHVRSGHQKRARASSTVDERTAEHARD